METTRVGDVLAKAKDAVDAYFPGYKGGLYKMTAGRAALVFRIRHSVKSVSH